RNHVQRAPFHGTAEKARQLFLHRRRIGPIIGRPGLFRGFGANERPILHARHIAGMRTREITAGTFSLVELDQLSLADHRIGEHSILLLRAVAPKNLIGRAKLRHFFDPADKFSVRGFAAAEIRNGFHFVLTLWTMSDSQGSRFAGTLPVPRPAARLSGKLYATILCAARG